MSVPQLSRITLITGRNGVGKTTVLEAVRVYAERGRFTVLSEVLGKRDEITTATDIDGDEISVTDYIALFYGRDISPTQGISIGPVNGENQLNSSLPFLRFFPTIYLYFQ